MLKHRVAKRSPRSLAELRQCVEKEWAVLELPDFVKYIENMNERFQAVVDAKGGHTNW
jgi:hypothetical protein